MLSKAEQNRYARHLILPKVGHEGQEKLKKSKVLVVGAGGLGSPVLQYLSAVGVGVLGVIDGDKVSESNLQRQILFSTDDVGKFKVAVAAERLTRLNPFIEVETFNEFLSEDNASSIMQNFDIIVDASDNFSTRYLTNDTCVLLNKPWVFGSIEEFEGQVSVFNYKGGATYRCLFPSAPEEKVEKDTPLGVLGVLPGVIGALQATEVIKIICNLRDVLSNKLLIYNALTVSFLTLPFDKVKV